MSSKTHNLIPKDFDARFQRAFGLLAFSVNRHIVDHMRRLCSELATDPETAQVWGTLGHMNALPNLPLDANPMEVLDEMGRNRAIELTPVRLTELAQVTALPRETVRRKLELLRSQGKVERTEDGKWLYVGSGIGEAEVEFTRKTILQFLKTAQSLLTVLDSVDVKPAANNAAHEKPGEPR